MLYRSLIQMAVLGRLAEGPLPMAQRREPSSRAPSRNSRTRGAIPMAHRRWANYTRTWSVSTMTFSQCADMMYYLEFAAGPLDSAADLRCRALRGVRAAAVGRRGGETIVPSPLAAKPEATEVEMGPFQAERRSVG